MPDVPPIELNPTPLQPDPQLVNIRLLAKVLDSVVTIPGTNFRIGLDAILGLIPGIGDAIGAVIGTYILVTAARLGVPKPVIGRMLLNIGADAVFGAVPLVGDVADAAWRANAKNAALLDKAMTEPRSTRRASAWLIAGVIGAVLGIAALGVTLTIVLIRLVIG